MRESEFGVGPGLTRFGPVDDKGKHHCSEVETTITQRSTYLQDLVAKQWGDNFWLMKQKYWKEQQEMVWM